MSLDNTSIVTGVSSSVEALSSLATGSSLTGATVTVTVAVLESATPSNPVYVKLSTPLKSASGVYVTSVPLLTTVPLAGWVTEPTVRASPSTSVSLDNTSIVTGVSSSVEALSSLASGSSLTEATVMVTVAVSVPPLPSLDS